MSSLENKIIFGSKSQPFYELSPLYYCPFEYLGTKWKTLMHFFVVSSISDLNEQNRLSGINDLRVLILNAKKIGFEDICVTDKRVFLGGIHEAFTQDKERAMILMSTGSSELIYNAPKSYLTENNRYGRLLMKMRFIVADEV